MQNTNTAAPAGEPHFTGWCLDKEDDALREKDRSFVAALLDAGLANPDLISTRLSTISDEHAEATKRALTWLDSPR